ncbi:acetate kinase, partial [Pelomonas sp. HMWF004]
MQARGKSALDAGLHKGAGPYLLALNSGSSSLKFGLYRVQAANVECLLAGETERIGQPDAHTRATQTPGRVLLDEVAPVPDHRSAVARVWKLLDDGRFPAPQAIGHRIVHGGPQLREHGVIDASVLAALHAASPFAPLHTPAALAVIDSCTAHFPAVAQAACLDTCFHSTMPRVASTLPLPSELRAAGLQRYGFHGLSCESIVQQLAGRLPERLMIAHLGNGASITAVRGGVSIDTSMGLTPAGGVVMGTRSGDLDPGVLVYLMREMKLDAEQVDSLVNHRSGLLGLSGVSGDMRHLHELAGANADARLAIDMFCYAVAKQLGAMTTVLGGADMIVFTGGIGEHDAAVRADICTRLRCHGVVMDEGRNRLGQGLISGEASRCQVMVLPSQEDEQVARH